LELGMSNEEVHAKQMQPAGHDNFRRMIPNFFNIEMIYLEQGVVLAWKPQSGDWSTHRINRDCGGDCPLVTERPMFEGNWPELKGHKLTFIGCHPETRHAHILDTDTRTGEYRIWLLDSSKAEPLVHLAAKHSRLEMTEFSVTYVSKDELLLHEGMNYRVYIVEPKLPLAELRFEDPIGPFEPWAKGEFQFKEQIIFIGDNRVMDYSSTTGDYSVYLYDRTVTQGKPPVGHLLSEGKINKGLQITCVGEGQLMLFDPMTGRYKAATYTTGHEKRPESGRVLPHAQKGLADFLVKESAEETFFGFGSMTEAESCATISNCSGCIDRIGCGWCETNQQCYRGRHGGPCVTNCTNWELNICTGTPCRFHRGCSECLADPFCGFCHDTRTCTEGSFAGPLFGSCEYSKLECPVLQKETEETGCTDELQ